MKSLLFVLCVAFGVSTLAQEAVVDISLSPAGSFKAKTSAVSGTAIKSGAGYSAENIVVDLTKLDTGIELRNEHTKEYLKVKEFPQAVLLNASGANGEGRGSIKIKGITKEIKGTYVVEGNKVKAKFPLSLKEFEITGINYMGVGVRDQVTINVVVPIK